MDPEPQPREEMWRIFSSVADHDPRGFFYTWIRDPDPGWTTRIIIPPAYNQFFGSEINIPDPQQWFSGRKKVRLTENLWRQAVKETCRLPQLEALTHPAASCTVTAGAPAPRRTVPTAARHRTVPPRRVRRRLMARRAAGLGTGRTHGRGTTRRSRRTDGRGTARRARRHLPRGYCGRRGVSAKVKKGTVVCKIKNYLWSYSSYIGTYLVQSSAIYNVYILQKYTISHKRYGTCLLYCVPSPVPGPIEGSSLVQPVPKPKLKETNKKRF